MSLRTLGLLPRILIAIALGVGCGLVAPEWLVRVFATFNGIFGSFLSFIIPLIILGLTAPAISGLGKGAGKWLAITTTIAYGSTLFAGLLGYGAGMAVLPTLLDGQQVTMFTSPETALATPYFPVEMPPPFSVMTALVLSFVVGVTLSVIEGETLMRGLIEFREIVNKVINAVIIPLLPIYIFGIFLNMTWAGQAWAIVTTFLGVILLVFALTWVLLLVQYGVAGVVAHRNPLRMLATLMPAYVTAAGTASSVATIPVTLRQTIASGVSAPVASFVVPLCATIHLAGSTVKITTFSLAVMMLYGIPIEPVKMGAFILMLGVTMVAAPGVPGGAIMTAAGLLTSMLGFTDDQVGLMIATYIAVDSFGTATNVTGDAAIAHIIDTLTSRADPRTRTHS